MSNSDDKFFAPEPKRRGRRSKPASLSKASTPVAEESETSSVAAAKPVKRGRRTKGGAAATPESPGGRHIGFGREPAAPPPPAIQEKPAPETFNTSTPTTREEPVRQEERDQNNAGAPESRPPAREPSAETRPEGDNLAPRFNGPPPQGYRGDRGYNQGGGRPWENKPWKQQGKFNRDFKKGKFGKQYPAPQSGGGGGAGGFNPPHKPAPQPQFKPKSYGTPRRPYDSDAGSLQLGELPMWESLRQLEEIDRMAKEATGGGASPLDFNELYSFGLMELEALAQKAELTIPPVPLRRQLIRDLLKHARAKEQPIKITGILDTFDEENGILTYAVDNYRLRGLSCFMPQRLIERWGLRRGHEVEVWAHPPRDGESCPFALKIIRVNGRPPEDVAHIVPFTELTPYYPTDRFLMETKSDAKWDNNSMRIVDLLTPVGLGQRGLIVAAPRTGKTVLMQGIANAIRENRPDVYMIILLVDERPEEVTDFRRTVQGAEVISSTFDEPAESHVHAAEMVIEKARRMIEYGHHVIILLDSITRLARAYNTMMPSSGKILSGGVEANALQKPKRFFGSARNIEGAGSLTILGTALVETGSKMDEVIFEEFKGTGNMELHLDRALSDKRIFPALNFEKSGTRKEELLYHKDELQKIYSLRRAMKGIPSTEAMEMLITRVKKTKTNAEFLVGLNR